jgi:hypothetical protein
VFHCWHCECFKDAPLYRLCCSRRCCGVLCCAMVCYAVLPQTGQVSHQHYRYARASRTKPSELPRTTGSAFWLSTGLVPLFGHCLPAACVQPWRSHPGCFLYTLWIRQPQHPSLSLAGTSIAHAWGCHTSRQLPAWLTAGGVLVCTCMVDSRLHLRLTDWLCITYVCMCEVPVETAN